MLCGCFIPKLGTPALAASHGLSNSIQALPFPRQWVTPFMHGGCIFSGLSCFLPCPAGNRGTSTPSGAVRPSSSVLKPFPPLFSRRAHALNRCQERLPALPQMLEEKARGLAPRNRHPSGRQRSGSNWEVRRFQGKEVSGCPNGAFPPQGFRGPPHKYWGHKPDLLRHLINPNSAQNPEPPRHIFIRGCDVSFFWGGYKVSGPLFREIRVLANYDLKKTNNHHVGSRRMQNAHLPGNIGPLLPTLPGLTRPEPFGEGERMWGPRSNKRTGHMHALCIVVARQPAPQQLHIPAWTPAAGLKRFLAAKIPAGLPKAAIQGLSREAEEDPLFTREAPVAMHQNWGREGGRGEEEFF